MKRIILVFVLVLGTLASFAQQPQRGKGGFDPKRFEADMEQFIVTEAGLTPGESAAFFPVFKEMMQKQRLLFSKMQKYRHVDMSDDEACR